jgi:hypothetical protein
LEQHRWVQKAVFELRVENGIFDQRFVGMVGDPQDGMDDRGKDDAPDAGFDHRRDEGLADVSLARHRHGRDVEDLVYRSQCLLDAIEVTKIADGDFVRTAGFGHVSVGRSAHEAAYGRAALHKGWNDESGEFTGGSYG